MTDKTDIEKFYELLSHQYQTEIRIFELLEDKKRSIIKEQLFIKNKIEFLDIVNKFNNKYNIYAGLNERKENGTEAKDVISIKKIFIDIDCSNKPSTKEDLDEAEKVVDKIILDIKNNLDATPSKICSGNGFQLIYNIPIITIDDSNRNYVEECIKNFSREIIETYSTPRVKIDNVGDLPRIIRVTGTLNIKSNTTSKFITYNLEESKKLLDYILSCDTTHRETPHLINQQLKVNKDFIEKNIIPHLPPRILDVVTHELSKEKLNQYGFPSRSERDQRVITHLVIKGWGKYIESIFELYPVGDKYREHSSPKKYLEHSLSNARQFTGIKSDILVELENRINFENEKVLRNKRDEILYEILKIDDWVWQQYFISLLAYKTKINTKVLLQRIQQLRDNLKEKILIDVNSLVNEEIEDINFYIEPIIPQKSLILICGKAGKGKSLITLSLILSLLTKEKYLNNFNITKKPSILLYDLENGKTILKDRLRYLTNGLDINKNEIQNFRIAETFNKINIEKELELCSKHDIIVLDCYRRFLDGVENDSETTNNFYNNFLKKLRDMGKSVIVIHHLKKFKEIEEEDPMDNIRGSSDISAQFDLAYTLYKSEDSIDIDTENLMYNINFIASKNRLGLPIKNFSIKVVKDFTNKKTSLNYCNYDKKMSPKERLKDKVFDILKTKSYQRKDLITEIKRLNIPIMESTIDKYLKELVDEFKIVQDSYGIYSISKPRTQDSEENNSSETREDSQQILDLTGNS